MRHALRFAAALVLPLASFAQEAAPGAVDPGITRAVEAGESPRVLARLNLAWAPEATLAPEVVGAQQAAIRAGADAVEAAIGGTGSRLVRRFETVPYVALQLDRAGLEALLASGAVSALVPDGLSRPALAQSRPLVQADQAAAAGFDGGGTVVAILDTGVSSSHPFLSGKVVDEACFSDASCPGGGSTQTGSGAGAPCSYAPSDCSHGTHVAGIAAGSGSSFSGIASGASLMAVQVFTRFTNPTCSSFGLPSPCALTYTSDQIAGLEHVYGKRGDFTIAAANMSLGGGRYTSTCDGDARKAVIDNLRAAGIATVIASGNDGFTDAVSAPACISSAIAVGSTTKSDLISSFSNSAARVALLAPGSSITSSVPGGGYASYSGTSMAAPHVAGAFAVLRDASPGTGVGGALSVLQSSGLAITDSRNGLTRSRIRINGARQALQPATLTPAATTVTAGSTLNVTVANGPGNRLDWVGFYAAGALDSAHEGRWSYLNGTKTAPASGLTGASLAFAVPAATGNYEFRFFRDNGFERLATSAAVTVQVSPTPVIQVTPPSLSFGNVNVGEQKLLTVTVTNRGNGTLTGTATAGGAYSVFSGGAYSLALDQSATVTVRFAPAAVGPAAGTLTLTGGGGASVTLAGDGVQGPSVTPSTTVANVGQGITATVANGPGNATDWVGLFLVGAADSAHEGRWAYLNGTKTAPTAGLASAALPFTLPATAGNYEFRFFRANGFERLATSSTIVVSVSPDPVLSVIPGSLSFGSVSVGSVKDLTVTVKNVGNGTLSGTASAGGAYSVVGGGSYSLASNQQQVITVRFAPPSSGAANGTLTLTGGGGGAVTLSGTGVAGPRLTPSTTSAGPGQVITVQVTDGPGNPLDWVGLYLVGAADNAHEGRWAYLNGTKTAPATGSTSAVLTFTLPAGLGDYEFRLYRDNGFERLATSPPIAVR
jgi:subtilisin family serine protease